MIGQVNSNKPITFLGKNGVWHANWFSHEKGIIMKTNNKKNQAVKLMLTGDLGTYLLYLKQLTAR